MKLTLWVAIVYCLTLISGVARATSQSYANYMQGLVEERAGRPAKALEAYEKVVAEDPQALEVYRDIAQLHLRLGHPDAALRAAEKVRELAPQEPDSFLFLGNVLVAQGTLAKAAEAYEHALQLDPKNLRALENLGNYYAILDPLKALSYYQRYLELEPSDAEVHFQMGLLQQKNRHPLEAEKFYKQAVALEPHQLGPHLALAELYESRKSTAQAIVEYKEGAALQPHNPLLFLRLGHLFYENKQWDKAYEAFQNARMAQPDDAPVYYWLSRVCEERKQWKEAAEHAEKAYTLSHDGQFLPLTAYYLTLDHRPREATLWLEKAKKTDPENPNVLLFLGMNYLDLDKPAKAAEILKKGETLYPHDEQLHFQMGIAEDRLGHADPAEKEFQTVLSLNPKNAAAMNYLGYSWADKGAHLDEAEKLLRKAVSLDPHNGAFLDSLGWTRHKRGDDREATGFLEQAIKESPDPLIYDHLGDVYSSQNQLERAVVAWNKGLALDPKNEALRKKAAEAAKHLPPTTDPRKSLQSFQDNMRKFQELESHITVHAKWRGRKVNARGRLNYTRPERLVLTLASPGTEPAPRLVIDSQGLRFEPRAYAKAVSTLPFESLRTLPQFFSGDLIKTLDSVDTKSSSDTATVHFMSVDQEAWIDIEKGMLTRFSGLDSKGGRDELEVNSYALVSGLWLPEDVRLRNKSKGWDAKVNFSEWVINSSTSPKTEERAE